MIIYNHSRWVNHQKKLWIVLILILCFSGPAQADVVTFVGSDCMLNLRVQEIMENLITGEMKRVDMERLRMGVSKHDLFSDRLIIRGCSDEFKVKMISMSEKSLILVLPRDIVNTINAKTMPETDRQYQGSLNAKPAALQSEVEAHQDQKRELQKARTAEKERDLESDPEKALFGSIHGRMLASGKPYVNGKVKVRRLFTKSIFSVKHDTKAQLFDAITDDQGVYRFERLPVGSYDIYWMPPSKDYWVRHFKEKPAFVIRAGEEIEMSDINASMRVVGQ